MGLIHGAQPIPQNRVRSEHPFPQRMERLRRVSPFLREMLFGALQIQRFEESLTGRRAPVPLEMRQVVAWVSRDSSIRKNSRVPAREMKCELTHLARSFCHRKSRKKVAQHLFVRAVEHYLPLYTERSLWSDHWVMVERPLFAGYVFVRYTSQNRVAVISTPGVVRLLGDSINDTVTKQAEIRMIGLVHPGPPIPLAFAGIGIKATSISEDLAWRLGGSCSRRTFEFGKTSGIHLYILYENEYQEFQGFQCGDWATRRPIQLLYRS